MGGMSVEIRSFTIFSSKHLIALEIFINCLLNNIFWQCPVISRMRGPASHGQTACQRMAGNDWAHSRLQARNGAVRGKHFITKDNISIFTQTELKLGISNDDTFA